MRESIAERGSFQCDIRWVSPRVLLVTYAGDVPAEEEHVRRTERMLGIGPLPVALCFEVSEMRSFHRAQVSMHARMLTRLAPRVPAIALVGARPAARFAAVTVSLMAATALQTFDGRREAVAWLESFVGAR
jgi:hypothetical protein